MWFGIFLTFKYILWYILCMDISDVNKYGRLVEGVYESPILPTSEELLQPVCDATGLPYDVVKEMDMGDMDRAFEESLGFDFIKNTRLNNFLRRYDVHSMEEYQEKVFNGDIRREDHYY